jgi:hypothetical protein
VTKFEHHGRGRNCDRGRKNGGCRRREKPFAHFYPSNDRHYKAELISAFLGSTWHKSGFPGK